MDLLRPTSADRASPPAGTLPPYLLPTAALYLDFDGTLAEYAQRPDAVRVSDSLPALLTRLYARHGGAVGIVTGRRLADVDLLLAPVRLPGAGVHGAEIRLRPEQPIRAMTVPAIAAVAQALHERYGGDERLLIEDKGAAVALHYRLAPARGVDCVETMRRLAASYGLEAVAGNQMVEAHAPGTDKGSALRELARHAPFAGRVPVFVGGDRTDEYAFAAARELGGYGIKVGRGPTLAPYRLGSVAAVHAWLRVAI